MKLAIIVVNYNDIEDTKRYVYQIEKYSIIDKIVIVDNMSTIPENSFDELKKLQNSKVDVIQSEKNGGYTYGNNFGIEYIKKQNLEFDYFAISNPDIEITENALIRLINFLEENENAGIAAPRMMNSENKWVRRSAWKYRTFKRDVVHSLRMLELLFYGTLRNGEYTESDYEKDVLEVDAISGAFFIIKNELIKKIGKFDDNVFLFYEEDILAKQAEKYGYKIYSLNDINFKHYESQTIGKTFTYFKKMKELYISKIYYHKTYTKINSFQVLIFKLLNGIRLIELLVEVPIRKLLKK